jgi:hypothetical protein
VREKNLYRKLSEPDSAAVSSRFALVLARSIVRLEGDIFRTLRLEFQDTPRDKPRPNREPVLTCSAKSCGFFN